MIKDTDFKQICENWHVLQEFMPKAEPEALENILWIRKYLHRYYKALETYYYSPNNPDNLQTINQRKIELDEEVKNYDSFSVKHLTNYSHQTLVYCPKSNWFRLYYHNTDITPILCIF